MPNPLDRAPSSSNVSVSLDGWPGLSELPLPDPASHQAESGGAKTRPRVQAPGGGPRRRAAIDAAASDPEELPVMQIVDVDPWPATTSVEMLPMPLQALPAAAPAASAPAADPAMVAVAADPDDAGAAPVDPSLAAILAALGALVGLRRRRFLGALRQVAEWRVAATAVIRRRMT
jgi:hypothetical protein